MTTSCGNRSIANLREYLVRTTVRGDLDNIHGALDSLDLTRDGWLCAGTDAEPERRDLKSFLADFRGMLACCVGNRLACGHSISPVSEVTTARMLASAMFRASLAAFRLLAVTVGFYQQFALVPSLRGKIRQSGGRNRDRLLAIDDLARQLHDLALESLAHARRSPFTEEPVLDTAREAVSLLAEMIEILDEVSDIDR